MMTHAEQITDELDDFTILRGHGYAHCSIDIRVPDSITGRPGWTPFLTWGRGAMALDQMAAETAVDALAQIDPNDWVNDAGEQIPAEALEYRVTVELGQVRSAAEELAGVPQSPKFIAYTHIGFHRS